MDTLALDPDCGIYAITAPSGRRYIGSAVSFRARWKLHLINLRAGTHHCAPLQHAYDKYGEAALQFSVIGLAARTDLLRAEQAYIDLHDFATLYNVNPIAGSRLGAKSSIQHRARISAALKGRIIDEAWRKKLSEAKRPPLSTAHRAKISAAHRGRKCRPETIEKMRTARSSSPYQYVILDKSRGKWLARPRSNGSYVNLGRFATPEQARAAIDAFLRAA